jgi:hypothetical protein
MNDTRSGISTVAEDAAHELRRAEHLERREAFDPLDGALKTLEAERARADAERLLTPPHRLVGDVDTEIVPAPGPEEKLSDDRRHFLDTLARPNTIAVDASEHRASVATRAGVLSPALDAAMTAGAKNSIEKMLCHQIAAVHMAGMELLVRVQQLPMLGSVPQVEIVRLTNGAARLFEVCQSGCLTLQKLKTRGTQRVVVQYQQRVNVSRGGQAVVAAKLGRGSRNGGKARRNGQ